MTYRVLISLLLLSCEFSYSAEKISLSEILASKHDYAIAIQKAIDSVVKTQTKDDLSFEPLLGGLSKSSVFLVSYKGGKYVMRLLDLQKELERRTSEVAMHQAAAKMKLAPPLLFIDREDNPFVLLMPFIDGRTFSKEDFKDSKLLTKVLQGLKKIQNVTDKIPVKEKTKMDQLDFYIERHKKKGFEFPPFYDELLKKLKKDYESISKKRFPSHGDFNSANILIDQDNNVSFIDFAERGYDHPFLDLGWLLFISAQTDSVTAKTILDLSFEREPSREEINELLFFEELTAFFLGTIWLTRQENRNIEELEKLFSTDIKKASDYVKEGLKRTDIAKMSKEELTKYSLGFFKDFLTLQQMRKSE